LRILLRADKDALLLHVKYIFAILAESDLETATGIAINKVASRPYTREEAKILGLQRNDSPTSNPSQADGVLILPDITTRVFLEGPGGASTLRVRIVGGVPVASVRYAVGGKSAKTASELTELLSAELKVRKANKRPVQAASVSGDGSTRFEFAVTAFDRLLGLGLKQFLKMRIPSGKVRQLRQLPGAKAAHGRTGPSKNQGHGRE